MTDNLEGGISGPQYNVAGILHYLQREFTAFELDRIQWDDERAGLKAQISFLQGEKEGHQRIMECLVKRIKMLEWTLRQERMRKSDVIVNGEITELSSDIFDDEYMEAAQPPTNEQVKRGRHLLKQYLSEVESTDELLNRRTARLQIMQSLANSDIMPAFHKPPVADQSTSPGPDRLDRHRVNNQDYGMGKRMMYHENNDSKVVTIIDDEDDSSDDEKEGDRQTEDALRAFDFMDDEEEDEDEDEDEDDHEMEEDGEEDSTSFGNQMLNHKDQSIPRGMKGINSWNNYDSLDMYSRNGKRFNRKGPNMRMSYEDEEPAPIPNQLPKGTDNIPSGLKVSTKSNKDFKDIDFLQTTKESQKADNNEDSLFAFQTSLGELAGIQVSEMESSYDNYSINQTSKFWWQLKCSMRAHFDSVRQLCFSPDRPLLFTSSDDATLRMWDVDALNLYKKGGPDVEPLYTFRGHTGPVLCCSCANTSTEIVLFSGGADSTVRYWRLPVGTEINIYDPYDGFVEEGELRGHEEAVWGIASHPTTLQTVSCGAGGLTCVWDISEPLNPLVTSFTAEDGAPATCVDYIRSDPEGNLIAVGHLTSVIMVYNIPEHQVVSRMVCEPEATHEPVNSLVSHPSNTTVIAGYADKEIRIFDVNTGDLLHHMTTHIEAVTSVTIDQSGQYLATVGHDCSLRIWNIEDKSCTQEMTAHQKKFDEAILSVAFHPSQTFIATAGADSTIKLYQ